MKLSINTTYIADSTNHDNSYKIIVICLFFEYNFTFLLLFRGTFGRKKKFIITLFDDIVPYS